VKIPFSRILDETFRSDHSLWIKMGCAGFVSAFCVLVTISKSAGADDLAKVIFRPFTVGILAFSIVAGAGLALMLSMKDVIVGRISRGEPVNPILRLYLGMGVWSLLAWFPTAFLLGILLIIATH
jgi:hypothetical protein